MTLLREIHREGNTLIMITHDKEIANQAERIIEIKDGKLREWNKL
ncbi:Macrolide export ATP-binding/permease protein MacB [Listeria monocytogenes]|nr:Macrolide export ATP-binding/permease protein MacB [Listeria monocytogenes]